MKQEALMFPTKNPGSRLTFILKDLLLSYLLTALLLLLLSLLLYRFSLSEKTVTLCITGIYILVTFLAFSAAFIFSSCS